MRYNSIVENLGIIRFCIESVLSAALQCPYRLHAVLVHEGQAASGHYWAYVFSPHQKAWLKFNDITVTEATWEELQKESVGGFHNASAYCLIYIDDNKTDLLQGESKCPCHGYGLLFYCPLRDNGFRTSGEVLFLT